MRGLAEEANLFSVAPAPLADEEMKSQPEPLRQWQRLIEGLGLEPAGLVAGGQDGSEPCLERGGQAFQELHDKGAL